ncbi:hypothetical protein Ddye_000582 [Dipteronia dyeriana]|uniref:G-patch domain-containing protein n=1 Tax=Dipteronia dyeriana TaxID=168575 RepID=A0AAE0CT83_9ROSI|nr:hypothetical protein Ddye_000582 [Dipteronia dyeriana]
MSSSTRKVSFSVQSKQASSKSNSKSSTRNLKATTHQEDDDELQTTTKQFVTEFDPNETLSHSKPQRIIIPRKPDECRPSKKMKNLDIVLSQSNNPSDRLQFEIDSKPDAAAATVSYGLTLRSINNAASGSKPVENSGGLLKDVKLHMDTLPEDQGFREFDDMPVEDFGAALLSGFGWFKGRGIGKNPQGDVEIKQVEKKSFAPDEPNIGLIAEKDKERDGFSVGKNVNSKHQDKDTKVKHQEIENQKRLDKQSRDSEKRKKREGNDRKDRLAWLRSHIRVRIISKGLKRGRLYLKKGEVVDVVGPNTCDIAIDESGELVQGVDQDLLETALPKCGGPVLVLNGRHKGVYGNLVERDLDRETGVVRDADSHELLNVKLEQIAEYIGDPSYIGY